MKKLFDILAEFPHLKTDLNRLHGDNLSNRIPYSLHVNVIFQKGVVIVPLCFTSFKLRLWMVTENDIIYCSIWCWKQSCHVFSGIIYALPPGLLPEIAFSSETTYISCQLHQQSSPSLNYLNHFTLGCFRFYTFKKTM